MNNALKYIGGLAIALSLFSCTGEKKEIVRPFTDVLNFDVEAKSITGGVTKTVIQAEKVETHFLQNPNWDSIELKPFIEADFNRAANKDKYIRTEEVSELAGWRDVKWISTNEKLPVKSAVYRYKDSTCIGASIQVQKLSKGYDLMEQLTYIPNAGYAIENIQNLREISGEQFYLSGEFEQKPQPWRMFFDIGNQIIPVNFEFNEAEKTITFHQGKEKIKVQLSKHTTVYHAEMPVFQSYLEFEINGDELDGEFHNLDKGDDYIIPFTGTKLPYETVFGYNMDATYPDFSGKWETYFGEDGKKSAALGLIDRLGDDLIGTFATETGDYRFLQGKVVGDSFWLSTFDGSHLFLFNGKINGDQITDGHFYSGTHYHTIWSAKRNDKFELTNPDELTEITQESFDFTFPDLRGEPVSLSDERFQNKVVIIQILGSWCPNCMDETRYFQDLFYRYNAQGLEIIGLAFERSKEFEKAKESLERVILDLDVPYTMLIAGTPKEASDILTMIDKVKSFPTSIILDKTGKVVKVHTGFYGPSTGKYYDDYVTETEAFIEELLIQ